MNERIVLLRKTLKLSQTEFAKKLNMTQNYMSLVENGIRNMSTRTILDICSKFGVNETWLRTGEGEMFAPKSIEVEVAEIATSILKDDNQFRRQLISAISRLNDDELDIIQKIAEQSLENLKKKGE